MDCNSYKCILQTLGHPLIKIKNSKNYSCYAKKGEELKSSKMLNQNHDGQKKSGSKNNRNKQGQEIVTNMVTVNPTISEITLNVKDLSMSIKK